MALRNTLLISDTFFDHLTISSFMIVNNLSMVFDNSFVNVEDRKENKMPQVLETSHQSERRKIEWGVCGGNIRQDVSERHEIYLAQISR